MLDNDSKIQKMSAFHQESGCSDDIFTTVKNMTTRSGRIQFGKHPESVVRNACGRANFAPRQEI